MSIWLWQLDEFLGNGFFSNHVACDFKAFFSRITITTYSQPDVVKRADQVMYEQKRAYYEKKNAAEVSATLLARTTGGKNGKR